MTHQLPFCCNSNFGSMYAPIYSMVLKLSVTIRICRVHATVLRHVHIKAWLKKTPISTLRMFAFRVPYQGSSLYDNRKGTQFDLKYNNIFCGKHMSLYLNHDILFNVHSYYTRPIFYCKAIISIKYRTDPHRAAPMRTGHCTSVA